MAILPRKPTVKFELISQGVIEGLYWTPDPKEFLTESVQQLDFDFEGIPGDRHSGYTKPVGPREKHYPKSSTIRNNRQWSAVCSHEMDRIAENLAIGKIEPEWIGANLLISGIDQFSAMPPLTHLKIMGKGVTPVTLVVFEQNQPCFKPDKFIKELGNKEPAMGFSKAAFGIRGLLGWVDHPGTIHVGDKVEAFAPIVQKRK